MNFIVNVIIQHVIGAFEQGWKTTVCGCIVAVLGVAPKLIPLFEGKGIDQVDWSSVGSLIAGAIGLVLAKDITITKIIAGAPKAKPVEQPK
ncbi:MAG TPA: hypothetical protein VK673_22015 [Chthoniobacterales bacterium]|nr:hypothetical protein [Chthoniobacterales bacterium]